MKDMTNDDFAKKLHDTVELIDMLRHNMNEPAFDRSVSVLREAARRLRELPDPTREPEPLTLRGLVERHGWAFNDDISHDGGKDSVPWRIGIGVYVWDEIAIKIVRGIVKGLCDERGGAWNPNGGDIHGASWYHFWMGHTITHATELEAIDALLTAMSREEASK